MKSSCVHLHNREAYELIRAEAHFSPIINLLYLSLYNQTQETGHNFYTKENTREAIFLGDIGSFIVHFFF